jgi:hypothetical protein
MKRDILSRISRGGGFRARRCNDQTAVKSPSRAPRSPGLEFAARC